MKESSFIRFLALVVISGMVAVGCAKDEDNGNPASANNHTPVIRSVTANPNVISAGSFSSSWLSCVATDPDGDSLSYHWSCAFGHFIQQGLGVDPNIGQVVEWGDASAGDYWINVTVNDGKDIDVDSVKVTVR